MFERTNVKKFKHNSYFPQTNESWFDLDEKERYPTQQQANIFIQPIQQALNKLKEIQNIIESPDPNYVLQELKDNYEDIKNTTNSLNSWLNGAMFISYNMPINKNIENNSYASKVINANSNNVTFHSAKSQIPQRQNTQIIKNQPLSKKEKPWDRNKTLQISTSQPIKLSILDLNKFAENLQTSLNIKIHLIRQIAPKIIRVLVDNLNDQIMEKEIMFKEIRWKIYKISPEKKTPIVIRGIPTEIEDEDIIKELKKNQFLKNEEIKIQKLIKKDTNPPKTSCKIIIRDSITQKLLQQERICLFFQTFTMTLYDFNYIKNKNVI